MVALIGVLTRAGLPGALLGTVVALGAIVTGALVGRVFG